MKQIIHQLKIKAKKNQKLLVFLIGLALIGFIVGCVFLTLLSKADLELVKQYITSFIENIRTKQLQYFDALKNTTISNFGYTLVIWLLGISIIGIPVILFLYFSKSFMIGFSISAFIYVYGWKGIFFAFLYIIPNLLSYIIFTILLVFALSFSYKLIQSIFMKKEINFQTVMNKYVTYLGLALVLLFIVCLLEVFVVPFLLSKLLFLI